jgi:hypothetical protein
LKKPGRPRRFTRAEIEHIQELYRKPGNSAPLLGRLFRCSAGTILRAVDGKMKANDD